MALLGVNVAILEKGQVLLTQRNDFPIWCLPGGAVEAGESLAVAAVREVREETGLEVQLTRLVGLYSRPSWREGGAHEALFAAHITGGALLISTPETVQARYFGGSELPKSLFRWHYTRIQDALKGRTGIVRVQNAAWPEEIESRQALYDMRDRGQLPIQRFMEQFCGPPESDQDLIEVQ
jgi:ADP-ribose pyrophosphatase YjhB (NUDIX family)